MKTAIVLIACVSMCTMLISCHKESVKPQDDTIPVTVANLQGNWHLVNDTTTQLASIMATKPTEGINYVGKPGDYYDFTSYGKLNMHNNDQSGTITYKLGHDTVFAEYAYIYAPTNHVDSAYTPLYIITHLTSHNCTMTEHDTGLELDSYSTINLSR